MKRYLSLDIETAKELPDMSKWRESRPLGITCAATCESGSEPRPWLSRNPDGSPKKVMDRDDIEDLIVYLSAAVWDEWTILTWNGAGFDFDVLAEESGMREECVSLAVDHVDAMFHIVCMNGFGVKLGKVAEALGMPGKTEGVDGKSAPSLWASGEYAKVIEYVCQDARLVLQVAEACEERAEFSWVTSKGKVLSKPIPGGFLTVRNAMNMPLPDTSWMTGGGLRREDLVAWIGW